MPEALPSRYPQPASPLAHNFATPDQSPSNGYAD